MNGGKAEQSIGEKVARRINSSGFSLKNRKHGVCRAFFLYYGETLLISLGNIVAYLTFLKPKRCIVRRSSPNPKPP